MYAGTKNNTFMKKISLLTFAFMAGLNLMAQDGTEQRKEHKPLRTPMSVATRFGLMAGVNVAKFNENKFPAGTTFKTNSKTSFHAGGFVNIPIGGSLRVQPGVNWNGYGSKLTRNTTSPADTADYEQDLHYISIPVMLQFQSKSGLFVETGPQASFLVTAKTETNEPATDPYNKSTFDKFDLSWGAGIGYLSRIGVGLNLRYNFGLSNVLEEYNNDDGPEFKNRVFQVGLVYHLGAAK
jgi:hypothetical protein